MIDENEEEEVFFAEETCEYCHAEIDLMDEAEENFCCDRRLWDYCCYETYIEGLD